MKWPWSSKKRAARRRAPRKPKVAGATSALAAFCLYLGDLYLLRALPVEGSEDLELIVVTSPITGRRFHLKPEGLEPPLAFDVAQLIATRVRGVFA